MPATPPSPTGTPVSRRFGPLWLDKCIRFAWTVMSFTLFGLGGLLLGILVFPLMSLVIRDRDRRERVTRGIVSQLFRTFIAIMARVGLTYRVSGRQAGTDGLEPGAPNAKGVGTLVIANHPTLIDVVFLLALFPGAVSIVKRALWFNPFTLATVRMARYIPNHDTTQLLDDAEARLRAGECLVLFPEGTRTVPGKAVRFRRGAALAAVRAGADIQPVQIRCEPWILDKQSSWFQVPDERPHFEFTFMERLSAEDYASLGENERTRSQVLTQKVQSLLAPGVK